MVRTGLRLVGEGTISLAREPRESSVAYFPEVVVEVVGGVFDNLVRVDVVVERMAVDALQQCRREARTRMPEESEINDTGGGDDNNTVRGEHNTRGGENNTTVGGDNNTRGGENNKPKGERTTIPEG